MLGRFEKQNELYDKITEGLKDKPYYLTQFFANMDGNTSISTIKTYMNHIIKFLNFLQEQGVSIEADNLKNIEFTDVNTYLRTFRYKVKSTGERIPYTVSYRNNVIAALIRFFYEMEGIGLVTANPCSRLKRQKGEDKIDKVYLNPKEIKTLIGTVQNGIGTQKAVKSQLEWKERDEAIITFMIGTGIRVGTIVDLNVEDINFFTKKVTIVTKGEALKEYVLTDQLLSILKVWLDKRKTLVDKTEHALFISNQNKRISYGAIRKIVTKYSGKIDKHITPHKLRATYGTNYYNECKDLIKTMNALGQNNPNVTKRYVVTEDVETQEAVDLMSNLIFRNEDV